MKIGQTDRHLHSDQILTSAERKSGGKKLKMSIAEMLLQTADGLRHTDTRLDTGSICCPPTPKTVPVGVGMAGRATGQGL